MMTVKLRIELIVMTVIFFLLVLYLIHKKKFELRYSLTWIALSLLSIIVVAIPTSWLENIATFLGIYDMSNMVFLIGIVGIVVLLCSLTIIVSKQSKTNTNLTQEVSILKKRVDELEKEKK